MDAARFDASTRSLTGRIPRRRVFSGLTAALGFSLTVSSERADAKRRKKLKRSEFGCVNVGGKCRGKDRNCCSGVCTGKKPKRGDKDKSRCVAHDAQGCEAGQIENFCGGTNVSCTTSSGDTGGNCDTTTGNAGYCSGQGTCEVDPPCKKDADCVPIFGAGAACVLCDNSLCPAGTGCAGLG